MLNPKQKKFAELYCGEHIGNAEQAAIAAGYSKAYARGHASALVAKDGISDYIKELTKKSEEDAVGTIRNIREFWLDVMNNSEKETKNRLRASELLAKSSGMFNSEW